MFYLLYIFMYFLLLYIHFFIILLSLQVPFYVCRWTLKYFRFFVFFWCIFALLYFIFLSFCFLCSLHFMCAGELSNLRHSSEFGHNPIIISADKTSWYIWQKVGNYLANNLEYDLGLGSSKYSLLTGRVYRSENKHPKTSRWLHASI